MINNMKNIIHKTSRSRYSFLLFLNFLTFGSPLIVYAQNSSNDVMASEEDFYEIITIPAPADVALEVSGIAPLPSGDIVVTTRFGEVWLVENPSMEGINPAHFKKIASGLHTPMGITYKDGKFYVAQRSELTELSDTNGDEIIDRFRTFCSFSMSGNYCEYVHGPILTPDGNFWVNMNLADNGYLTREPFFGEMGHHAPWKGWAVEVTSEGELQPFASGLRSPAGMGIGEDGTKYYSENQGGWVGTGYVTTIEEGDFFGHPSSLKSSSLPKSNNSLAPEDIPDRDSLMLHDAVKILPQLKMPSVRLPHGVMGISLSWILEDNTGGEFGPFGDQLFVADQGQSKIMRIFLEKVKGKMQGAAFQFRKGFRSGIIRSSWGIDGSMYIGMSDRGWNALGSEPDGLQRLVWTGRIPFEVKAIRAKSDGFELEFTKPVDLSSARSAESYNLSSFDYLYRKEYGSPLMDQKEEPVKGIIVSKDGLKVRLVLKEELRSGYIYEISTPGIISSENQSILHPEAFYSLNQIPEGEKANLSDRQKVNVNQIEPEPVDKNHHENSVADKNSITRIPEIWEGDKKHMTSLPDNWEKGPDKVISIGTEPGMQYDIEQFEVKAGSRVKLIFTNSDDLLHNLVITTPGSATMVGEKALEMGINGPRQDYVPEVEQVLFYINILEPGNSQEIYFTVPSEPGDYQFVCTFPGHYITMRGIMKVVQ